MKTVNEIIIDLASSTTNVTEFKPLHSKAIKEPINNDKDFNDVVLRLQNETVDRQLEDNRVSNMISDESVERAEQDTQNRINIANELIARAEADAKLAIELAKESSDRAMENSDLSVKISKLQVKLATIDVKSIPVEKDYVYKVLTSYNYPISYTQGLVFHQGTLYESTGLYGKSVVRKINLDNNQLEKEVKIGDQYFGEGITIFNNKIIHITWKSQTGFVYDLDLNQLEEFKFTSTRNEGWGITHDNKNLIVSDGSEYLHFWNPETKKEVKKIQVLDRGVPVKDLNELEYFEGYVLANVWKTNKIVVVNANTGVVENTIDFSELAKDIVINDSNSVFNGIAYDGTNFYVTGKNWGKIWKIDLNIKGK